MAAASVKIADKRMGVARIQRFAAAATTMVCFGGLCLSMGYALGSARVPPWTQGSGVRRLVGAALGAPAGWMLLVMLLPALAYSARSGWVAARATEATSMERARGRILMLLPITAAAALTTFVVRLL